jgi:hypothetical protein
MTIALDSTTSSSHRIELPGASGWSVWTWFNLRGAGFPVQEVLRLASPRGAEAASRALALEDEAALAAYRDVFAEEALRIGRAIRDVARWPVFREAVTWQSRAAIHGTIDALLRTEPGRADSETRRREHLVVSYLQRYCTKNESIGFFGPWGWGRFSRDGAPIAFRAGPTLIAGRRVFFEYWAIDALAARLASDPSLRPWLPPRRHPSLRIEGDLVHTGTGSPVEVSAVTARLLATLDGVRPAREIAEALLAGPGAPARSADEIYQLLDELAARRWVLWTLEIPTHVAPAGRCLEHERFVRERLLEVGDDGARSRALGALDELTVARDRVAESAGDPDGLDKAIAELEATFGRVTGAPAARNAGKAYAGRSVFYDDCVRDAELTLGPDVLAALAPGLAVLLSAARWYTFTIARRYRELFARLYAEASAEAGTPVVDYQRYWRRVQPHFAGSQFENTIVAEVEKDLKARWMRLFNVGRESAFAAPSGLGTGAASRVALSAAEASERARAEFAAPHPGWPTARYHAPDLLIAARDVEAIGRGDFLAVLGEVHTGVSTLAKPLMFQLHPDAEALVRAVESDLPMTRIMRPEAKDSFMTIRLGHCSFSRQDLQLEAGTTRSFRPRGEVIALADLVVEAIDGRVCIRTRDGARRFDVIAFFEEHLRYKSTTRFGVLPTLARSPRVMIERFILSRERWRFAPDEVPFAHLRHPHERFLSACRWARGHSLPRHLFVKIPEERKPYYLDLHSPPLVDLFARLARRGSEVIVTEMVPGIEDTWLTDAEGRTYTSELRVTAVDPEPWRPE